jgi:hypothetical protein
MQQLVLTSRVTPFGNLRVAGYVLLTAAFRSLSRPSSPYSSKASTINPYSLDHIMASSFSGRFLHAEGALRLFYYPRQVIKKYGIYRQLLA